MNVVVKIDGRDAFPVWTIPYVTDWDISPDMLVKRLVAPKYNNESTFPAAFNLDSDRNPHLIPSIVWNDYAENSISDFEDETEDEEISQREKRNKWRMDSVKIIMEHEGCYIWLDEFKKWLEWYNDFKNDINNDNPIFVTPNENDQGFSRYRIELWLTPSLPPELAQYFKNTELVNAGEHTLGNVKSEGVEPLNNEIETPNSKAETAPVIQTKELAPWLIADTRDPKPEYVWYTPARYFARQLVKDDSTLLIKRPTLAYKVALSLDKVGIKKRGGIKPFDAGTVLKALSNVVLS